MPESRLSIRVGCGCDLRLFAGRIGVPAHLHARHPRAEFHPRTAFLVRRPAVARVRMSESLNIVFHYSTNRSCECRRGLIE